MDKFHALFLERIGNMFQEYETQHHMLVFRCVHGIAELVRRLPERGLKTQSRSISIA